MKRALLLLMLLSLTFSICPFVIQPCNYISWSSGCSIGPINFVNSSIYYDSNNSNYYLDPSETSYLNSIYIYGSIRGFGGVNSDTVKIENSFLQVQLPINYAYAPSSSTRTTPPPVLEVLNDKGVDGTPSVILFTSKTSNGVYQQAYFGIVNTGSGSYTPKIVMGLRTGSSSYEEVFRVERDKTVMIPGNFYVFGYGELDTFEFKFNSKPERRGLTITPDPDGRVIIYIHQWQNNAHFEVRNAYDDSIAFLVNWNGDTFVYGDLTVSGTKSALYTNKENKIKLAYAIENLEGSIFHIHLEPEVKEGENVIELPEVFINAVVLNTTWAQITPIGENPFICSYKIEDTKIKVYCNEEGKISLDLYGRRWDTYGKELKQN